MKQKYLQCFTNMFIAPAYQTLSFNTSWLNWFDAHHLDYTRNSFDAVP
jgi:hypothetical protein